jgi:flavin reductase (DIM6/NTAB) family NADH-FMN oxidoreductase RutF
MSTTMKRATRQAFVLPNPVGLVTVAEGESGSNIVTIAWVGMACSDPVTVTIAVRPSRHSHELLLEEGEFVLNIPGEELLDAVDVCGKVSGGDSDKWELTGLTPEPALEVRAPLIAECPYSLECRVIEMLELGAHDLFVARVLAAHADERILDERGRLDYAAFKPLGYLPYEYRGLGPKLDPAGTKQS